MRKNLNKLVAGAITAITLAVPFATFGNSGQVPTTTHAIEINSKVDLSKYDSIQYMVEVFEDLICTWAGTFSYDKFAENKEEFRDFWLSCPRKDKDLFLEYQFVTSDISNNFFGTTRPTFDQWLDQLDFNFILNERQFIDRTNPDVLAEYYDVYEEIYYNGGMLKPPYPIPPVTPPISAN